MFTLRNSVLCLSALTLAMPALADVRFGNPPAIAIKVAGPSSQKIDIVFVGDGYAPNELGKLVADAKKATEGLLQREPFKKRANDFNFLLVNVWSPGGKSVFDVEIKKGKVDDVDRSRVKDTVKKFGFFDGLDRTILLVNKVSARAVAFAKPTGFLAGAFDLFGGFRDIGPAVLPAADGDLGYVAAHELGHTMGNLADEYTEQNAKKVWRDRDGSPKGVRGSPVLNLTGNGNASDPRHPFRVYFATRDGVGLFPGGDGDYVAGLFRLTQEGCAMRNYGAASFCPVCNDIMDYMLARARR